MSYVYHVAKAHQEALLREAQRGQNEDGAQAPEGKSLLKSSGILNLRLASNLLRKTAGEAPTTA
jgi:hypothetical protein